MMRRWITDYRRWLADAHPGHQGQAMVVLAMLMPILIGIAGLTIDAAVLYQQRRNLQSIADAAALTGAQKVNFNSTTPVIILPDGHNQATWNALINGAQPTEVTVRQPTVTPFNRPDYIEVIVTRDVSHSFMRLFGFTSTTIHARAVARCFKSGYGDPAVLALDPNDSNAMRYNGGGTGVEINGDMVSFGGINPNGDPDHFHATGSAIAMNGPAPNLDADQGTYGDDSGVSFPALEDPIVVGLNAIPPTVIWPTWPTEPSGPGESYGTATFRIPLLPDVIDNDGQVTTQNGDNVVLSPGYYRDWDFRGGTVTLSSGVYVVKSKFRVGSQANVTGSGVIIRIDDIGGGNSPAVDVQGGATFLLSAQVGNTWKDIVLYVPTGDVDIQGNDNRTINGTIYAPLGEVAIAGNNTGYTVNGQVIAFHVQFSGNGGAVNYSNQANNVTFAPFLINTPN